MLEESDCLPPDLLEPILAIQAEPPVQMDNLNGMLNTKLFPTTEFFKLDMIGGKNGLLFDKYINSSKYRNNINKISKKTHLFYIFNK